MAKQDKYSIKDLRKEFPNDNRCLEYLFDTLHSRECSCGGKYARIENRKQFQCSKCRFQIAPMTNTIFEKSSTPLTLWFYAIFIFSNAKSGISAKELERQIGTTYKTAWRMLKLIRQSISQGGYKLRGDVEMDEAYFGGRGEGGEYNKNFSEVMANKVKVIGAVERGGEAKAQRVPNINSDTVQDFVEDNIDAENTRLLTDQSNRYEKIAIRRQSVNHSQRFVSGDIHTNSIEGFWAHLKRSIKGTHKTISKKYFQSYLDAFVFHYNNRHNDRQRFEFLLSRVVR